MRDATHAEHLEQWARYVRENSEWKAHHTAFIDAQFMTHRAVLRRLLAQTDGARKIIALYDIKNTEGYKTLLMKRES